MGNKKSGLKHFTIPFNLEEEESQYWLGYICADGNVQYSTKYRVYKVSLFSKDLEIIQKFQKFIGSRCNYHLRKQNGIHEAYINSIQLCKYLINLNIVPNKSLILNPYLPLTNHFIRGYFDGDGSISSNSKECKFTTGSEKFKERLEKYLKDNSIFFKTRKYNNAYYINIERKRDCINLLNLIYLDSNIYLDRKFKRFVALTSDS